MADPERTNVTISVKKKGDTGELEFDLEGIDIDEIETTTTTTTTTPAPEPAVDQKRCQYNGPGWAIADSAGAVPGVDWPSELGNASPSPAPPSIRTQVNTGNAVYSNAELRYDLWRQNQFSRASQWQSFALFGGQACPWT